MAETVQGNRESYYLLGGNDGLRIYQIEQTSIELAFFSDDLGAVVYFSLLHIVYRMDPISGS